jgi:hypothetical protein
MALVMVPRRLVGSASVSEEHTVSIFIAELCQTLPSNFNTDRFHSTLEPYFNPIT